MKYKIIYFLLVFLLPGLFAQSDTLSLSELIKAGQEYTLINKTREVRDAVHNHEMERINAANLPGLQAYGKAWYQSDAITVIAPQGAGLEIDRFQYNTGVEANQKIYDGGLVNRMKDLERARISMHHEELNVDLYHLTGDIVEVYFQILLLQRNQDVLKLQHEVLTERIEEGRSAYTNGLIRKTDLEKLTAAQLAINQQIIQIETTVREAAIQLENLTGMDIGNYTLQPDDTLGSAAFSPRPEYAFFEAKQQQVEDLARVKQAAIYPKVSAYGQAGYSYPGLNFFENEPAAYYIVGARLSWTIFDWSRNKQEVMAIREQENLTEIQANNFQRNIETAIRSEMNLQESLKETISLDRELIESRSAITRGSHQALQNGVITSAEYLEDLNAETEARIILEIHRIQLQHSLVKLKLLRGIAI